MTALALVEGGDVVWNSRWPQGPDPQGVITVDSSSQLLRPYGGTLILHAGADVSVEPIMGRGHAVRAIARHSLDLNNSAIATLYADATAGARRAVVVPFQTRPDPLLGEARLRVSRLTDIQVSFGAPLRVLAEILRVSRPQLYKWLNANHVVRLQAESIARLEAVEQLALNWSARSTTPLAPWFRQRAGGDQTILDLLTAPNFDLDRIDRALDVVVRGIENAPKSRAQRMREAGFTRRATHRSLPSDE